MTLSRLVLYGFVAAASASPVPFANNTLPPFIIWNNGTFRPTPLSSNDTLIPFPMSNDTATTPLITLNNTELVPFAITNGTLMSAPTPRNTLILCNDFNLSGPCSYTALPDFDTNCTHVSGIHYSPDSTKFSFISSIQMPPGYVCRFQSGRDGCIGHGSARALRLIGPQYHDCRPDWDNQITYFDCKPT